RTEPSPSASLASPLVSAADPPATSRGRNWPQPAKTRGGSGPDRCASIADRAGASLFLRGAEQDGRTDCTTACRMSNFFSHAQPIYQVFTFCRTSRTTPLSLGRPSKKKSHGRLYHEEPMATRGWLPCFALGRLTTDNGHRTTK